MLASQEGYQFSATTRLDDALVRVVIVMLLAVRERKVAVPCWGAALAGVIGEGNVVGESCFRPKSTRVVVSGRRVNEQSASRLSAGLAGVGRSFGARRQ